MSFGQPWLLFLLVLPAAWLVYRVRARRDLEPTASFAAASDLPSVATLRTRARAALPILRFLVMGLLVVALARPRMGESKQVVISEGIDIILALDTSGSMRAEDFQPDNRLTVAKEVARRFVEGRRGDRIGLVVFASSAYTQCPLTTDHVALQRMLDEVDFGGIRDGTAIGMAIATGVNRLRETGSKSRVLILLTDGRNNAGTVDPATAAELARAVGVRIHTIGAGSLGEAPYPVDDPVFGRRTVMVPVEIDEKTLQEVAATTGGSYFRATDAGALEQIYKKIDTMEKTRVETKTYVDYSEFGGQLLMPALLLLIADLLLRAFVLRKIP